MSCNHKFQNELRLEHIDYAPTTLIVGTFNPEIPAGNDAKWFYDTAANNHFWNVLPRLYGESSLTNSTADEWKAFCRDKQIALTDIIDSIDDADLSNAEHMRALGGFSDKALEYKFEDFNFVNIVQLLQRTPSIKNVYFTRGITEAFWRYQWNPAMLYCNRNQLHERRLLTPSDTAQYQLGAYNLQHPENQLHQLEDYILMRWREEWHTI